MFNVETQGTNTYLVYQLQTADKMDTVTFGMLKNNTIDGLSPFTYSQMDRDKFFKYNTTAKISLEKFLQEVVTKNQILKIWKQMVETLQMAGEYLIPESSFLLSLDNIYVNVGDLKVEMICIPIERPANDVEGFFKSLIYKMRYAQNEDTSYVIKLIEYFNGAIPFSIDGLKELIDALNGGNQKAAKQVNVSEKPVAVQTIAPMTSQAKTPSMNQAPSQPVPNMSQPAAVPTAPSAPVGSTPMSVPGANAAPMSVPGANVPPAAANNAMQHDFMSTYTPPLSMPKEKKEKVGLFGKKKEKAPKPVPVKKEKPPKKEKPAKKDKKAAAVPTMPGAPSSFAIPGANSNPIPTPQASAPVPNVAGMPAAQAMPMQNPGMMMNQPNQYMASQASFGETTVLNADAGETTVLNAGMNTPASTGTGSKFLIRVKTQEKIHINRPLFKIGKEASYVNYCISDNPTISRSHADVIDDGNALYICDNNSRNHTYVNDQMVVPGQQVMLNSGDRIRLSDEEFDVRIF